MRTVCAEYFATAANRVVLIRYMLIPGPKDSPAHASELATLLRGRPFRLDIVHPSPPATAPLAGTVGARMVESRRRVDSPSLMLRTSAEMHGHVMCLRSPRSFTTNPNSAQARRGSERFVVASPPSLGTRPCPQHQL